MENNVKVGVLSLRLDLAAFCQHLLGIATKASIAIALEDEDRPFVEIKLCILRQLHNPSQRRQVVLPSVR
ncbi:hypothetical protein [Trichothermofontia sp.]